MTESKNRESEKRAAARPADRCPRYGRSTPPSLWVHGRLHDVAGSSKRTEAPAGLQLQDEAAAGAGAGNAGGRVAHQGLDDLAAAL